MALTFTINNGTLSVILDRESITKQTYTGHYKTLV